MDIKQEEGRHYIESNDGSLLAEITYVSAGETRVIIDHTFVAEEQRQEGLGAKLVSSVVSDMRDKNKKIIPLCPFAKAEFERNKEYQSLLAN
ncbi:GNAT family N-acetyltransferase [Geomicrobium sp. JCM 19055]|uniref:GNAT family N-acetyltransferase n=1 Tax=Geomicrobium sp. JCM 19055 TaxID=1460649 RepID=UPI00045ECE72|nr:GNAT family N-acetyltransferase [Geomicrobium sp. JCM 19055]GAK00806.1 acetyltransferase [Geomicrobium sp. JCM 19055]